MADDDGIWRFVCVQCGESGEQQRRPARPRKLCPGCRKPRLAAQRKARRAAGLVKWYPAKKRPPKPRRFLNCLRCGDELIGTRRKYCSKKCAYVAAISRKVAENAAKWPIKPCEECGVEMVARDRGRGRRFCSRKCQKRAGDRVRTMRRRALVVLEAAEFVDPLNVFERDRWRCQLCGVKTPQSLRGKINDRAPELDHIEPLSAGGEHSYRNTQCACRKCNLTKGTRPLGQLRLVA